jgi:hypothetical protein
MRFLDVLKEHIHDFFNCFSISEIVWAMGTIPFVRKIGCMCSMAQRVNIIIYNLLYISKW